MEFTEIFATMTALVAAIPVVTQAIKKIINKDLPSWVNQVLSWGVGIVLCMFGWFFDLGCLDALNWWQALLVGFGTSLAANGVFDISLIKWILNLIFGKVGVSTVDEAEAETTTEENKTEE